MLKAHRLMKIIVCNYANTEIMAIISNHFGKESPNAVGLCCSGNVESSGLAPSNSGHFRSAAHNYAGSCSPLELSFCHLRSPTSSLLL